MWSLFDGGTKEGWKKAAEAEHSERINTYNSLIKWLFGYDANTFQGIQLFASTVNSFPLVWEIWEDDTI